MKKPLLICTAFACLTVFSFAQVPAAHPFKLHRIFDEAAPDREETRAVSGTDGPALHMEKATLMDEKSLETATVSFGAKGWEINILLTKDGAKRFAEITTDNERKRIGIVLNGSLKSAPIVMQPITGGSIVISGTYTEKEAKDLAASLNAAKKARH